MSEEEITEGVHDVVYGGYKTYNPLTTGTYDLERERVVKKEPQVLRAPNAEEKAALLAEYDRVARLYDHKLVPKDMPEVDRGDLDIVLNCEARRKKQNLKSSSPFLCADCPLNKDGDCSESYQSSFANLLAALKEGEK